MKQAVFVGLLKVFAFCDPIRRNKGCCRAPAGHAATGPALEASLFFNHV